MKQATWEVNGQVIFESDDPAARKLVQRIAFLEREATRLERELGAARKQWDERWYFLVPKRLRPRLRKRAQWRPLERKLAYIEREIERAGR